jgi:hypothetical protein
MQPPASFLRFLQAEPVDNSLNGIIYCKIIVGVELPVTGVQLGGHPRGAAGRGAAVGRTRSPPVARPRFWKYVIVNSKLAEPH